MITLKRFICPPIMGRGGQGMYIPLHVAPDEIGPNDLCSYAEAHAIEAERDALRAENEALQKDKERLDWLEKEAKTGACPGLIFDDNKFWAIAESGFQQLRVCDEPEDYTTTFFVEAKAQRETVREAIDAAMKEE